MRCSLNSVGYTEATAAGLLNDLDRVTAGTKTFACFTERRETVPRPAMTLLRRLVCAFAIAMSPLPAQAELPGPICIPLEQKAITNEDSQFPSYPFVKSLNFQLLPKRDRINVLLERLPCEEFCRGVISIVDPKEQIDIEAEFVNSIFVHTAYGAATGRISEFVENMEKLKISRIVYFKRSDGRYIYIRHIRRINPNQNWEKHADKATFYRNDYQIVDSIQHSGAEFCLSGKYPF